MNFTVKTLDNYGTSFTYQNSKKQIVCMEIYKYCHSKVDEHWVMLTVKNKRKQIYDDIYLTQTGKAGIETLLIAKEMLKTYIETLLDRRYNNTIFIEWEDNRRRDVYERGLRDLGFKLDFRGHKVLFLNIPKRAH